LFIGSSTIGGDIVAEAPNLLGMCDTQLLGGVTVLNATSFVVIGDPGDDGCPGNGVGGSIILDDNRGGLELEFNQVGGSVLVDHTSGAGPFPDDTQPEIVNNTIGGDLSCSGNVPPPTNRGQPNIVTGVKTGQCADI
jgi:hypothetical protein